MRGLTRGDEFLECGLCTREKPFACFGQSDAAGRAGEERCAEAPLERAHGLAGRRGSDAELTGCFAKTAVPGNAQEGLDAVERALSDCEVLLHGACTLS